MLEAHNITIKSTPLFNTGIFLAQNSNGMYINHLGKNYITGAQPLMKLENFAMHPN